MESKVDILEAKIAKLEADNFSLRNEVVNMQE